MPVEVCRRPTRSRSLEAHRSSRSQGVLTERYKVTPDQALLMLVRVSNTPPAPGVAWPEPGLHRPGNRTLGPRLRPERVFECPRFKRRGPARQPRLAWAPRASESREVRAARGRTHRPPFWSGKVLRHSRLEPGGTSVECIPALRGLKRLGAAIRSQGRVRSDSGVSAHRPTQPYCRGSRFKCCPARLWPTALLYAPFHRRNGASRAPGPQVTATPGRLHTQRRATRQIAAPTALRDSRRLIADQNVVGQPGQRDRVTDVDVTKPRPGSSVTGAGRVRIRPAPTVISDASSGRRRRPRGRTRSAPCGPPR